METITISSDKKKVITSREPIVIPDREEDIEGYVKNLKARIAKTNYDLDLLKVNLKIITDAGVDTSKIE